ncbi:hypothetical protein OK016_08415 [Vibrio chagasii]|nr:hypothetical protein [Vibrio chagasii]
MFTASSRLGAEGLKAIERLMGLLLVALSTQMFLDGGRATCLKVAALLFNKNATN